jgi:hypothetical protein
MTATVLNAFGGSCLGVVQPAMNATARMIMVREKRPRA